LKRDWARVIGIGGALVVIQSIAWEFARMKPDNKYFVEPWAYRGYESIHGTVFAVIGFALLVAVVLVASKASQALRNSISIVALMVVAAWLITLVFASGEDFTLTGDSIVAFLLAAALGFAVGLGARRYAEHRSYDAAASALKGATG
jgi:fatty-acid desaturase